MQQLPAGRTRRFRTIWISDVHLGFRGCSAEDLLGFLAAVDCEYLYLVGDIVDLWQLKKRPYWPPAHNEVVRVILAKAKAGTRVTYIPGNHDALLRDFAGHVLANVAIEPRAVHERADGSRLLILHGDEFDAAVTSSRWLAMLGGHAYEVLLKLNVMVNFVRRHLGFPHWSLATYVKFKVKNAVQAITNFEHAVAQAARFHGVDGVVCGHIHRPELCEIDGVTYCNCGDWVESCTALVEHADGALELLNSHDLASIAVAIEAPLPAAA